MKKVLLTVGLLACVATLTGCQSNSSKYDNADSNAIEQTVEQPADDAGEPPVPPEPTQAQ
jgi:hypothetical protein